MDNSLLSSHVGAGTNSMAPIDETEDHPAYRRNYEDPGLSSSILPTHSPPLLNVSTGLHSTSEAQAGRPFQSHLHTGISLSTVGSHAMTESIPNRFASTFDPYSAASVTSGENKLLEKQRWQQQRKQSDQEYSYERAGLQVVEDPNPSYAIRRMKLPQRANDPSIPSAREKSRYANLIPEQIPPVPLVRPVILCFGPIRDTWLTPLFVLLGFRLRGYWPFSQTSTKCWACTPCCPFSLGST